MRSAVTLAPRHHSWIDPAGQISPGQAPLPFPGAPPVLPVPVDRSAPGLTRRAMQQPVARFMQALTEVLTGERPVRQLTAWMTPDVHDDLAARLVAVTRAAPRARRAGARLVSVHVAMIDHATMEVAGRMVHRGRSRAIAVRLELLTNHRGATHWICTALEWA